MNRFYRYRKLEVKVVAFGQCTCFSFTEKDTMHRGLYRGINQNGFLTSVRAPMYTYTSRVTHICKQIETQSLL